MLNRKAQRDAKLDKAFDRMILLSTIPLNAGTEDTSPPPPSCLDMKFEAFTKTYSNITDTMDGIITLNRQVKKRAVLQPFKCKHSKTEYNYGYKAPPETRPDPCTYNPEYEKNLPQTTAPKFGSPPKPREIKVNSTEDVVRQYQRDIRNFDPSNINLPDCISRESVYKDSFDVESIKEESKRRHKLETKPEINERFNFPTSVTANIEYADPPEEWVQMQPKFDQQLGRKPLFVVDEGREYPKAKVPRPKVKGIDIALAERERKPKKNSRIEFLDKLKKERLDFINEVNGATKVKTIRREKRPKSTFDIMMPRKTGVFPNQNEVFNDPKIPVEVDMTIKKEVKKSTKSKIHGTPQDLKGRDFWTRTKYKY